MVALVVAEVTIAVLAWRRVHEWLRSPSAAAAAEMQRELGEHLLPLLRALSRLYPLPTKLTDLIEVSVPLTAQTLAQWKSYMVLCKCQYCDRVF